MKSRLFFTLLVILLKNVVLSQSFHYKIVSNPYKLYTINNSINLSTDSLIKFEQDFGTFLIRCDTSSINIIRICSEGADTMQLTSYSKFEFVYINANDCGILDIIQLNSVVNSVKYESQVSFIDLTKMELVGYGYNSIHISHILIDSLGAQRPIPAFNFNTNFLELYTIGSVNEKINIDSLVAFQPLGILASCLDDAISLLNTTGYSYYYDATEYYIAPFRKYILNDNMIALFQIIYFDNFQYCNISVALVDKHGAIIRTHSIGQINPFNPNSNIKMFKEFQIESNGILHIMDNKGKTTLDLKNF